MEQINRRTIDANSHSTEGAKPVSMICRWISKDNCHKLSDIVVMLAIIVALWLTMVLPTIIYVYKTVSSEVSRTNLAHNINLGIRTSHDVAVTCHNNID